MLTVLMLAAVSFQTTAAAQQTAPVPPAASSSSVSAPESTPPAMPEAQCAMSRPRYVHESPVRCPRFCNFAHASSPCSS